MAKDLSIYLSKTAVIPDFIRQMPSIDDDRDIPYNDPSEVLKGLYAQDQVTENQKRQKLRLLRSPRKRSIYARNSRREGSVVSTDADSGLCSSQSSDGTYSESSNRRTKRKLAVPDPLQDVNKVFLSLLKFTESQKNVLLGGLVSKVCIDEQKLMELQQLFEDFQPPSKTAKLVEPLNHLKELSSQPAIYNPLVPREQLINLAKQFIESSVQVNDLLMNVAIRLYASAMSAKLFN